MQQQKEMPEFQNIVESDAKEIYLGNLNRVEADLKLPETGKRGSNINWHSGEILFLSDDGKITRPTNGVGNRMVALTATLTYRGAVSTRQFDVMIIEEPKAAAVTAVHPVHVVAVRGEKVTLPPVVIVDYENDVYSVAKAHWDEISEGTKKVCGTVEGTDLGAIAAIQYVEDAEKAHPHSSRRPIVHGFHGLDVTLREGSLFYDSQESFLQYLLTVNDDQMLYNFRKAANLDTLNAPPMTGWDAPECNLKGHTTGHYLSALSLAYSSTGNKRVKEKLDYMVNELGKCQDALSSMPGYHDGFLSAYSEEQFDLLQVYTTYPSIWAPYYTLHKIMAGLLDGYLLAQNEKALAICTRLGDWVFNRLSKLPQEQLDRMWSMYIAGEFGGMIEVLVSLSFATGNEHYLTAAKYFRNDKLYYPMSENADTLEDMHANQHIPQIIGAMKLFEAEGEEKYYHIALNFWKMVTGNHLYSIGGTGENEMFKRPGKIGGYLTQKTAENCATYNMLKLTRELFQYSPNSHYMDYYEQALYNHILSSCDSSKFDGGSTYFMPLAPGSQKVFQTTENTCCHGTGLENHFKFGESIYFYDDSSLFVNFFIPSAVKWNERQISLSQTCGQDDPGSIELKITGSSRFTLKVRKPAWTAGEAQILINGKTEENVPCKDGYLELIREWNDDMVTIHFPLSLRIDRTPDRPEIFSIFYGPYILAALSDQPDFLIFDLDEKSIFDKLKKAGNALRFEMDGLTFIPLNRITNQKYHAYFKN